jgi:hypothetical protein
MHYTLYLMSNNDTFTLDPAEPELEELQELAPAEETNIEQSKASPNASNHAPCLLSSTLLYVLL